MIISWFGHSCFKIQTKDATVIIDPFDPKIGLKAPRGEADIVLVSHDHYDHNNIDAIKGAPFIIREPGEYEVKNVFIYGIPSYHDKTEGKERGDNIIYLVEAEDMKIAHLGDLGQASLTDDQLERLDGIDVLLIPIGGDATINAKEAVDIINQIEPRIVVPMHYKTADLKLNLDGLDKFCKEIGVCKKEAVDKLKLAKKDLPIEEMEVIPMQIS